MLTKQNLCPNCYEAITNPICDNCLTIHFEYWLEDLPVKEESKVKILNIVKQSVRIETANTDICIACGKEAPGLCPYCFSLKVSSKLRNLHFSKRLIENFEYLFSDRFFELQEENGIKI